MASSLYRLVYYSRNRAGRDGQEFKDEVDDILEKSRVNNTRVGITGALMFNSGCFAQVLEGGLPELEETFERIQQDLRHSDVSLIALDPIEDRSFPNWSMGFVGRSRSDDEAFSHVGRSSGFDPQSLDGDQIHAILKELAIQEENF